MRRIALFLSMAFVTAGCEYRYPESLTIQGKQLTRLTTRSHLGVRHTQYAQPGTQMYNSEHGLEFHEFGAPIPEVLSRLTQIPPTELVYKTEPGPGQLCILHASVTPRLIRILAQGCGRKTCSITYVTMLKGQPNASYAKHLCGNSDGVFTELSSIHSQVFIRSIYIPSLR